MIFDEYRARFVRVVDGDTFELDVDLGFHVWTRVLVRLQNVNTPERGEPNYSQARDFTGHWFRENGDSEGFVVIMPELTSRQVFVQTFVRYVAEVESFEGRSLAEDLVEAGLAK